MINKYKSYYEYNIVQGINFIGTQIEVNTVYIPV